MSVAILVSGGAGYIGSHICYALKQAGMVPVALDDLSMGNNWAASFGPFAQGDVGDADFVRDVCEKYKPVAVIHCAGIQGIAASFKNSGKYFNINRDKTSRFFKTLSACGVTQAVLTGTAAVYGNGGMTGPIPENCAAVPVSPYGQSNLEAEAYLRMLSVADMRSVTLRCFNVAGAATLDARIGEAHVHEEHLIARLVLALSAAAGDLPRAAMENNFATYGDDYPTHDGTAIRDYLHVCDLADAHLCALDYLFEMGKSDIFNIGSGQGASVMQVITTARKLFNRPDFSPSFAPRREGDNVQSVADIAKAKRVLGWKPERSLADTIRSASVWHGSAFYRAAIGEKIVA